MLGHYLANDRTRPDVRLYRGKAQPDSDKSGHCDVVNLAISIYLKSHIYDRAALVYFLLLLSH